MMASPQRSAASDPLRIVFVTGSDTGVGKTVLTALLTRHLRARGINTVGLKPLCSGGREDAVALAAANGGALPLDEVNPWHFKAALAPVLAARREGRGVRLKQVVAQVRAVAARFELVVVEGAGGLLSPLGQGFDNRDLLAALHAVPVVVVPNRLGGVNQARLVWEALPLPAKRRASVVLMSGRRADAATKSNAALLKAWRPDLRVVCLPWLKRPGAASHRGAPSALGELARGIHAAEC
jgi:dethiobiotin synthetase